MENELNGVIAQQFNAWDIDGAFQTNEDEVSWGTLRPTLLRDELRRQRALADLTEEEDEATNEETPIKVSSEGTSAKATNEGTSVKATNEETNKETLIKVNNEGVSVKDTNEETSVKVTNDETPVKATNEEQVSQLRSAIVSLEKSVRDKDEELLKMVEERKKLEVNLNLPILFSQGMNEIFNKMVMLQSSVNDLEHYVMTRDTEMCKLRMENRELRCMAQTKSAEGEKVRKMLYDFARERDSAVTELNQLKSNLHGFLADIDSEFRRFSRLSPSWFMMPTDSFLTGVSLDLKRRVEDLHDMYRSFEAVREEAHNRFSW